MTGAEWNSSANPTAMIDWLEMQGYIEPLWQFTIACCRRIWDELPGDAFRRVIIHFEQIGVHDIDNALADAYEAVDKLERKLRKAKDAEQSRISRQIGLAQMVFVFENQASEEAATGISRIMVEWAEDGDTELRVQADLLRKLVPDPSVPTCEE